MVCPILVMRNELPSVFLAVFYSTGIEICIDVDRQGGVHQWPSVLIDEHACTLFNASTHQGLACFVKGDINLPHRQQDRS